ncbi:hypothetical protein [Burkholderia lata]|uniref:hypothetical protein n=1 Tax=Burkholderia lata (strain ATCC 17760 / DSM 23089 / LMG 22485 / NCIMB 9086 / R18194 / 383) TaxID=482957 RepID=UPI00399C05CF
MFDQRVEDLLVAIALTAGQHRRTSESEAWVAVVGERWRDNRICVGETHRPHLASATREGESVRTGNGLA